MINQYIYHAALLITRSHLPPGLDKMVALSWTTVPKAFSRMKNFSLRFFEFRWSVFPKVQLTIRQHWFGEWLGAGQATRHYGNQCWPSSPPHICGTRRRWVKTHSKYTKNIPICLVPFSLLRFYYEFLGNLCESVSYLSKPYAQSFLIGTKEIA